MNTYINTCNQDVWEKLSSLKTLINKKRKKALKTRLMKEPYITDLEYLLGAFLEMYEPHLEQIVFQLSQRGYAISASSGFGGKYAEYQSLNGHLSVDYVTRNKLEKIGVKSREYNGVKSLIFWPDKADLDYIKEKWMQITDILPDKGVLAAPSHTFEAVEFRRKYVPKDPILQRRRLFERLRYNVQRKIINDIKKRRSKNPNPDSIESRLGLFIEELEPQVKQAVLTLTRKGYSTDASGFMDNPCDQMIEGDFQLNEVTIRKLKKIGAQVLTNASGYTRVQFSPKEADTQKIKREWDIVVSFIPDKNQVAASSMTSKAREFRRKY